MQLGSGPDSIATGKQRTGALNIFLCRPGFALRTVRAGSLVGAGRRSNSSITVSGNIGTVRPVGDCTLKVHPDVMSWSQVRIHHIGNPFSVMKPPVTFPKGFCFASKLHSAANTCTTGYIAMEPLSNDPLSCTGGPKGLLHVLT
jgi:hypothetical protein